MKKVILFSFLSVAFLPFNVHATPLDVETIKAELQKTCEKKVQSREGKITLNGLESCMRYELKSLGEISATMTELSESPAAAEIAFKGCAKAQLKKGKDMDYSRLSYCLKNQKEALYLIKTALQSEKDKDQAETCFLKQIEKEYTQDEVFYHTKRCLLKRDNLLVLKGQTALNKIVFSKTGLPKTPSSAPVQSPIPVPAPSLSASNPNQLMVSRSIASTTPETTCSNPQKVKEDFYFSCRGLYAMAMEEKRQNYDPQKAGKICKCLLSKQRDIASVGSCEVDKEEIKKLLADASLVEMCDMSKSI